MVGEVASQIIMKEKTPLSYEVVCLYMLVFETPIQITILVRNYFFLKNYVPSEGAVFNNVL